MEKNKHLVDLMDSLLKNVSGFLTQPEADFYLDQFQTIVENNNTKQLFKILLFISYKNYMILNTMFNDVSKFMNNENKENKPL